MLDLSDYEPDFLVALNPPGVNLYAAMTSDEMVTRLVGGFWELRMSGADFLGAYTCSSDGLISNQGTMPSGMLQYIPQAWYTDTGDPTDLGREIIQAIIIFAAFTATLNSYQNLKTSISARSGSNAYEVTQASSVLVGVLKALTSKVDIILTRLTDLGSTSVTIFDAVINETNNIMEGNTWFTRGSYSDNGGRPY